MFSWRPRPTPLNWNPVPYPYRLLPLLSLLFFSICASVFFFHYWQCSCASLWYTVTWLHTDTYKRLNAEKCAKYVPAAITSSSFILAVKIFNFDNGVTTCSDAQRKLIIIYHLCITGLHRIIFVTDSADYQWLIDSGQYRSCQLYLINNGRKTNRHFEDQIRIFIYNVRLYLYSRTILASQRWASSSAEINETGACWKLGTLAISEFIYIRIRAILYIYLCITVN